MKFREAFKQLMQPIIGSAAMRLRSRGSNATKTSEIAFHETGSGDRFSLGFFRVDTSAGSFFVPKYAKHRPASKAILNGRFYEPMTHSIIAELLRLRPGHLIHAGTFFGDMLPSFSRACSATVYAFEPVLENYVLAKLCVQQNNLENVFIQNAGLGSSIAVVRVDTGVGEGTHRGGKSQISDSGQLTALLTIDSLGISGLSVIQLDVEGHELEALRGGAEAIVKNLPLIMIEDINDNCQEFLDSIGYQYAGKVPGLKVWKSKRDSIDVQSVLDRI